MPMFLMADRFVLSVSSIAASMFWTCPGLAVVSVAEIPRLRRKHRLIAFRADWYNTGVHGRLPPRSLPAVRGSVSTLAGRAAPALIGVSVSLAEARPLRDKLWAIVPGASTKTHGRHLQPLVAGGASGMSGVRLPRRSPSWPPPIHGPPTQRVSPPWSTSFDATAPRVASGSMPDSDDYKHLKEKHQTLRAWCKSSYRLHGLTLLRKPRVDQLGLIEFPHATADPARLRQSAASQPVRHLLASGAQARTVGQPVGGLRRRTGHDRLPGLPQPAGHQHVQVQTLSTFRTPAITHPLRYRQGRRTIRTLHDSHTPIRRRAQTVDTPKHPVQPISQITSRRRTHHTRPRPAQRPIRRTPPINRQQHPLQIDATSQPKHQTRSLLIHLQPMHTHRQTRLTTTNTTTALADVCFAFGERAEFWDGFCEAGDLSAHVFGAVFAEGCLCFGAALLAFVHDVPAFG